MNIDVNTDHNIEGSEELNTYVASSLASTFERYNNAITRIVVHLSDENAGKVAAKDKKCLLANHQPIVVTHHADTIHQAIDTASDKLLRALGTMAGKMTNHDSPKDFLAESPMGSDEEE